MAEKSVEVNPDSYEAEAAAEMETTIASGDHVLPLAEPDGAPDGAVFIRFPRRSQRRFRSTRPGVMARHEDSASRGKVDG